MSIFLPISSAEPAANPGVAEFQGRTTFTATGTVSMRGSALFASVSTFQHHPPPSFDGSTVFTATGRLNDEANVFGAALFAGSTTFTETSGLGLQAVAVFSGSSGFTASPSLATTADYGFTFYVDILDSVLAAVASGRVKRYTWRLLADGDEVPTTSFRLTDPTDRMGMALNCVLARPDTAQITFDSSITFQIGVWGDDDAWHWTTMVEGGRLASGEHSIGFAQYRPTDQVSRGFIDPLGDRMSYAPRAPVTLYNPDYEEADEPNTETYIYTDQGDPIKPTNEPVSGLSLKGVIERAYVEGCGFDAVLTNIPDVPVTRVDFTLDGGYDGGVRPLVSMFDPLYFTVEGNVLWIYNMTANVPAGFTVVSLPLTAVISLQDSIPAREPVNAMIVSYQADIGLTGEFYTETLITETPITSGTYGSPDFQQTDVVRRVRQYRMTDEPTVIIREETIETTTSVHDAQLNLIHRERLTHNYNTLGLSVGHRRTVEDMVPDFASNGDLSLQTTETEICVISYKPNPFKPTETLQDNSTTTVTGLALLDNDNTYRDEPFKMPLRLAHQNGVIDTDADQESQTRPLRTTIEQLRVRNEQELDVQVIVFDHLANTVERSSTTPRVASVSLNKHKVKSRQSLITIEGTEGLGRRVPTLNAGMLPASVVLPLARKKLEALNNPPRTATVQLPDVNFGLRKGTVVKPDSRSGVLGTYIVTGRAIQGQNGGQGSQRVDMTIDLRELK